MSLRRVSILAFFASVLLAVVTAAASRADSIWIEGEAAARKSVQQHSWYNSVKKDVLSGEAWLSHYGDKPGEAGYDVEVAESGKYTLWARLNPVASKPSWRIDGGDWAAVDFKEARGQQNVAADNKPDHRFIAWVKLGALDLKQGKHAVDFRWEGGAANSGALDCFVLTSDAFVPAGARKPGDFAKAAGADDWFALLADEDPLSSESIIDMSRFVPAPAGHFGQVIADGKDLRFASGKRPVKFWGCGANVEPGRYTREQLTQRAKYLRKFGVNVVRQHAVFDELQSGGKIDAQKLDEYDYWFAELKKNGIYSDWSVFYHFTIGPDDGYDAELFGELDGRGERKDTYGVICMSPELWRIRNKTLVALLDHKNPYTGRRYADDPALAVVEMNNEDSIFFWNPLGWLSEGKRMPKHSQQFRRRWAAWVAAKYTTDAALRAAWGELRGGDSVAAEELRLMGPWELPGDGPRGTFAGRDRRAGDYVQFLAEMQRDDFAECERAIRATGYKALTVTTGWQVGGAATEAANIWTDSVASMIDRHNYFGGGAGGHGITEGKVNNTSHLATPGGGLFSIGMKQVENKPFSVTEWTQSPPNQWKLEAAPIVAFYGMGLQGWDASFHFAQTGTRLGDGWPGMSSYRTDTPHYLGQFPALAFALYHGHVSEGPIVAGRRLSMADVFSGRDALLQDSTAGGYDAKTLISKGGAPAEAFAVGRVTVGFDGGKGEQVDYSKFWDERKKTIRSATGELEWDYGHERIIVRTAKTQAIVGKTGDGKSGGRAIELPDVAATFKTPFVSVIFTPLDDRPLKESKQILITALARDAQSGAKYNGDGTRLEAVGTAPLMLEPVQATLRLAGAKPRSVVPCDHYGVPMSGKRVEIAENGEFQIDGTHRAYYYDVRR
ncbi:MAG: hypothetical protein WD971_10645 [Pirellulales bacterium]